MRNLFSSLTVALFLVGFTLSSPVAADELDKSRGTFHPTMKISIDPVWVFFGAYLPTFEAKVSDKVSVRGTLGFINTEWTINKNFHQRPFVWIYSEASLRYYAIGEVMNGLFLESSIKADILFNRSGKDDVLPSDNSVRNHVWFVAGHHLDIGYAWTCASGLSIEGSVGFHTNTYWGWTRPKDESAEARLALRVGYAF